jgi:ABC-2 type transport system ATP-binding protein
MTILLQTCNLVKVYGGVKAVDDISFEVASGSCFGLLGPNGAGKTTTLELLENISQPTSGNVFYDGRKLGPNFREEVGIQLQSTSLQERQTVGESLKMFASLFSRTADLDELVETCGLRDILDRDAGKLSGGQRQRMLLAIALVNDPRLLFLDEPTIGLDPQSRRNFWGLIESVLRRGTTVVLTTHYMEEAQHLCDEIVIMDRGRIVARGEPHALIQKHLPASIVRLPVHAWPRGTPLPEGCELGHGYIKIFGDEVSSMLETLGCASADLRELCVESPNLEDLFLKLTGHALRS